MAKQQAQQAQDIARLQEQLDASQKALDQQKAAAQKLEQVKKRHIYSFCWCCICRDDLPALHSGQSEQDSLVHLRDSA